ncbi:MAG: hypothetical protein ACRBCJ_06385 [Hyphomicrobiaceae bacterium]
MMNDSLVAALIKRRTELLDLLESERPDVCEDQKHLENGSHEQAYWQHGYQTAINDILESIYSQRGDDITPGRLN